MNRRAVIIAWIIQREQSTVKRFLAQLYPKNEMGQNKSEKSDLYMVDYYLEENFSFRYI